MRPLRKFCEHYQHASLRANRCEARRMPLVAAAISTALAQNSHALHQARVRARKAGT